MKKTSEFFEQKYGYQIYKKTSSLSQLLQQAECDAIGIAIQDGENKIYAVDVAFHESGLNYGDRPKTVMKILAKSIRTAMCIYGYFDTKEAEIIFASPKIGKSIIEDITPCEEDMQNLMNELGFHFRFRIIANGDFREIILNPILMVSGGIADTNELFLRSYQMLQMFDEGYSLNQKKESYNELKVGRLAQIVMRKILESDTVPTEEIINLQNKAYSKKVLGLNFPALVKLDKEYDPARYYKDPLLIYGQKYLLCSQWSESPGNNDRPYILKWIEEKEQT